MSSQVISTTGIDRSAAASDDRRQPDTMAGQTPARESLTTMPPPIPRSRKAQSSQPHDRPHSAHIAATRPATGHTFDQARDYTDVDDQAEVAVFSNGLSIRANQEREQEIDDVMVMATSHMWEEDVIASDSENGLDETGATPDTARWVKKARRARRNSRMRNAASWLVSILVGGFIVATVAIILLAGPGRFNAAEWLAARATTEQPQSIAAPKPKPAKRVLTGSIVTDQ